MAKLHELKTFSSESGDLTVFEDIIPGVIQRVFYIYNAGQTPRAGHRHKRTWNALICLQGSCRVYIQNGREETFFNLDDIRKCLVLKPEDWHLMDRFSEDAILLVVSNQLYDKDDYIYQPYSDNPRVQASIMTASE